MLLTPSRADMIIFGIDNVLTDPKDAYAATISRCVGACRSELLKSESEEIDTSEHFKAAYGRVRDCADIAWLLLLSMTEDGSLPSVPDWLGTVERFSADGTVPDSALSVERASVAKVFSEIYSAGDGASSLEKPLFRKKWSELRLPVAVCTPRGKRAAMSALSAVGWGDFPASRIIYGDAYKPSSIASLCAKSGCTWPLYLGALPSDRSLAAAYGKGDFITIGNIITPSAIRFSSAADALRAILGVF